MKLQTFVSRPKKLPKLDYASKPLFLGSCFSSNMAKRLEYCKFDLCSNPFGTLYQPEAIFNVLAYGLGMNEISMSKTSARDSYVFHDDAHSQIFADDELVSDFLSNDCKFDILERQSKDYDAQSGHVQFFKTKSYIEGGMENENFKSWGPEDAERLYRFTTLGYNVSRINDWVYHLEHARGENSWYNNPYMQNNTNLWESLQRMNKDQLKQYYTNQDYIKKYK